MAKKQIPLSLQFDSPAFDGLQLKLLREIIVEIKHSLSDLEIEPEKRVDIVQNLSFGISAILDGSRVIEHDGASITPILSFQVGNSRELITSGGSWMHEYVCGMIDDVFSEEKNEVSEQNNSWFFLLTPIHSDKSEVGRCMVGADLSKSKEEIVEEIEDELDMINMFRISSLEYSASVVSPKGVELALPKTAVKKKYSASAIFKILLDAKIKIENNVS